jgi:hypothetical protein
LGRLLLFPVHLNDDRRPRAHFTPKVPEA